jgi:dihydroxyacetone kinase-like protein
MQRFVNNPDYVVEDMAKGLTKVFSYLDLLEENDRVIYYNRETNNKVGLVSGGGSGHEPAFLGYVGENMLDAVAIGEVFSSPTAQSFYQAFKVADNGKGVACLFGNYAGDNMNVKMAIQMAEEDEIDVKYVVATDDISSAPKGEESKRHGIAGGVFMWKIAGAKAALGAEMNEVLAIAQKTVDNTRSICVGLEPCVIPAVGKPNFIIEDGNLEFGIGHHGEPGAKVEPLKPAKDIAREMCNALVEDLEVKENQELAVLVSGLGATPIMEQYIIYNDVENFLKEKGIKVYKSLVGNYVTSLDMNGIALTILRVDEELKSLLSYEAECPGITVRK